MIICARSTSRSREQTHSKQQKNMWKVCLFYSQNHCFIYYIPNQRIASDKNEFYLVKTWLERSLCFANQWISRAWVANQSERKTLFTGLVYTKNIYSRNTRSAQRFMGFFLDHAFRALIGWAGKLGSRGKVCILLECSYLVSVVSARLKIEVQFLKWKPLIIICSSFLFFIFS